MSNNESRIDSTKPSTDDESAGRHRASTEPAPVGEVGGRGTELDPVRYGDWEKNGRCIDF